MVSLYSEIINFDGVNFQDHLERVGLSFVFEPVISEFDDNLTQIKVSQYIAYSHSLESSKITIAGDRRKELQEIYKWLKLPDDLYEDVVLMKNRNVLESIKRWMIKQDNRQIEYLFTLQNAYIQQQTAALQDLRKSTGEIDWDQKMRCVSNMTELKEMMKTAESELQQQDDRLKETHVEIKKVAAKFTISPENFAK